MIRAASRVMVVMGLLGLLLPGLLPEPVSGATAPLSTGWASFAMGTPASHAGSGSLPFFVVHGGPGLVAISQPGGGNVPCVWVSADGRRWRSKALDRRSFAGVLMLSTPALGRHGLVMVGTAQGAASSGLTPVPQGIVWTSRDGLSWRRIADGGNVFRGATLNAVIAGGPGYVAVGTVQTQASPTPAVSYRAAVWTSSDGAHWKPASIGGSRPQGAFMKDVAVGGPGLVAVGFAYAAPGQPAPAVWTSGGGRTWRRLPLGTAFPKGGGIDRIVAGRLELLALGHDAPARGLQHQIVWTSRDGSQWRRVATDPVGLNQSPPAITPLGSGFAAVGRYDNAPALWTSADGSRWTVVAGDDVFGGGITALADAVAWRNGLLVIGQHSKPPIVSSSPAARVIVSSPVVWLQTPGTRTALPTNWATDPLRFRLRLADLGPRFIPRTAAYSIGCALIPDLLSRAAHSRFRPAMDARFDGARCERAVATLGGSTAYGFSFGYGASNLYGPEPEVVGFAIQLRSAAQSRASYRWGGGIVIAGDLNLNAGTPRALETVKVGQGGTLYSIATQGFGTAYAVVWRAGPALGMVETIGVPGDAKARAIALARAQWRHWKGA